MTAFECGSTINPGIYRRLARRTFRISFNHFHLAGGATFETFLHDGKSLMTAQVVPVLHAAFIAAGLAFENGPIALQTVGFACADT